MRTVYLWRTKRSDEGTEGLLVTDGFNCKTLELPWRDNQPNLSCIPTGIYHTIIRQSPKFGIVYWLQNVPNRSYILIHSGNVAGDKEKGYKTNVYGCILLGKKMGTLWGQRAVLNSRITVNAFKRHMSNNPFMLQIMEAF